MRVVPTPAIRDLLSRQAEQKEIFLACGLSHFNGCPVARSYGQGAVHHEFHVAGSAGLLSGSRNLLGYIACWNQQFGNRNAVVRHEDHLEPLTYSRISLDSRANLIDEL